MTSDDIELSRITLLERERPLATPPRPSPSLFRLLCFISLPALIVSLLSLFYINLSSPSSTTLSSRPQPTTDESIHASSPPPPHLEDWIHRNRSNVNVFERLEIGSKDGKLKARFIALGASLVDLEILDRNGNVRDIVASYADSTSNLNTTTYPYFGSIVGRYANRISNHSFYDPLSSKSYNDLPVNEGKNTTLHGGQWGYSRSGWNVLKHESDKIVFGLEDRDGTEGFPGTVYTTVTYQIISSSSSPTSRLLTTLHSKVISPRIRTPIMLSSHVYFSLNGWKGGKEGRGEGGGMKVWCDAREVIEVDDELIPTGKILTIPSNHPLDFFSGGRRGDVEKNESEEAEERSLKDALESKGSMELCGKDCTGIDNALIFSSPMRDYKETVVMKVSARESGIRMKIRTNQPIVQLYTLNSPYFSSETYPLKPSQLEDGDGTGWYDRWSGIVIEPQGWIDGLHHRDRWELGDDQWYDDKREYNWWTEYEFETF